MASSNPTQNSQTITLLTNSSHKPRNSSFWIIQDIQQVFWVSAVSAHSLPTVSFWSASQKPAAKVWMKLWSWRWRTQIRKQHTNQTWRSHRLSQHQNQNPTHRGSQSSGTGPMRLLWVSEQHEDTCVFVSLSYFLVPVDSKGFIEAWDSQTELKPPFSVSYSLKLFLHLIWSLFCQITCRVSNMHTLLENISACKTFMFSITDYFWWSV